MSLRRFPLPPLRVGHQIHQIGLLTLDFRMLTEYL